MYFASDIPKAAQVAAQIVGLIGQGPALSWYALVDGAFDYRGKPLAGFDHREWTYASDEYDSLLAASPYLVALETSDSSTLLAQIVALVRHRGHRPMLSFIGSEVSAAALNQNFRQYASAATSDKDSYILRFADTRVLPSIAVNLRPTVWRGITRSIQNWAYIDRDGSVKQVAINGDHETLAGRFELSNAELAALVSAAEPDAVINALERSNPDILPEHGHAEFYDLVAEACLFAGTHGVIAFPDIVAIATYTIVSGVDALAEPRFLSLITGPSWERGNLIKAIVEFANETS